MYVNSNENNVQHFVYCIKFHNEEIYIDSRPSYEEKTEIIPDDMLYNMKHAISNNDVVIIQSKSIGRSRMM